jgi:CRISPR-associated endonuclease/helicase Cas3
VPYGNAPELLDELERHGPSRDRLRALQRFTVNVRKTDRERWLAGRLARFVADTVVALEPAFRAAYDLRFGLDPERVGLADPSAYVF